VIHHRHVPRYLIATSVLFWALIFVAWLSYPAEGQYSIGSHTFSFLGSWNEEHNPRYWWIFTIAMLFWGLSFIPIAYYKFTRFQHVSKYGAMFAAFWLAIGGLGIAGVGLIPDVRDNFYGFGVRWTDVHERFTILVVAGFLFGLTTLNVLLNIDRIRHRHFGEAHGFGLRSLHWPFVMLGIVFAAAIANQLWWSAQYEARKAQAELEGIPIGSSWKESLHTIYAFPLWEHILIYALAVFIVWFTLALHAAGEQPEDE